MNRYDEMFKYDGDDISIISYILHADKKGVKTIKILSDDTDVVVITVYWCWKQSVKSAVQRGTRPRLIVMLL